MDTIIKKINFLTTNKILVYGDFIIDIYINSITNRISNETPIPVFEELEGQNILPGGAGNVLNNLLTFNDNCHLLTILEEKYENMLSLFSNKIINIKDDNYINIIKTRYFCFNQNTIRIDKKNNYIMSNEIIEKIKIKIDEILPNYNIVIISDYNTGIVNYELAQYIINSSNKLNIKTLIDPKNSYLLYKNCTIIKSNKKDAEKYSKIIINNNNDAFEACNIFLKKLNINECIITLSENGCVYMNKSNEKFYVKPIINNIFEIMDVTGAGDTFVSTFAIGIINSLNIEDNLKLCNKFCNDVIKRKYVSTVNMLNIFKEENFIFDETNYFILKKFLLNKKVVFTTGCFDLLHEGHIETFKVGKQLGDILIVALNDDNSIKKYKGDERPINNLHTRLTILLSIKYIDFIIIFSSDTPNNIYNILEPDILIKGDDYSIDKITEIFPRVKNFISIKRINNINTTNIINKIRNSK